MPATETTARKHRQLQLHSIADSAGTSPAEIDETEAGNRVGPSTGSQQLLARRGKLDGTAPILAWIYLVLQAKSPLVIVTLSPLGTYYSESQLLLKCLTRTAMFMRPVTTVKSDAAAGAIELISYKPKQGIALSDALALDLRVRNECVVKQPGFISRHTGVTKDGTVFVQVLWDSIPSVKASQAKGMKNELMGKYMQVMDQQSIKFHNIDIKQ